MDIESGKKLIEIARKTIESHLSGEEYRPEYPEEFDKEMGVFVTLTKRGELRGCIGFTEPIYPLIKALQDAAVSASTRDPRFPPVTEEEFREVAVEVTVLTRPELIKVEKPEGYLEKIEIGKDGLIVEAGLNKGLLLPQVPGEWGWNKEEFLSQTCLKAGLPPDYWKKNPIKLYKFQGEIFSEESPGGKVIKK